jgi:hypothetical protein
MKIHACIQGTSEWLALRMGRPTSSQFHRIITPRTLKSSTQADGYCNELLAELIMGRPIEGASSPWMDRGKTLEEEARSYYEMANNCDVQTVGFITSDDGLIGCSPDSLVGDDGLVEIKCPSPAVHVGYLLGKEGAGADVEYRAQVQGQMLITGRAWCDIISYHPEMPAAMIHVPRDEEFIAALKRELDGFLMLLDVRRSKLEACGWISQSAWASAAAALPAYDWLMITDADIAAIAARKFA